MQGDGAASQDPDLPARASAERLAVPMARDPAVPRRRARRVSQEDDSSDAARPVPTQEGATATHGGDALLPRTRSAAIPPRLVIATRDPRGDPPPFAFHFPPRVARPLHPSCRAVSPPTPVPLRGCGHG